MKKFGQKVFNVIVSLLMVLAMVPEMVTPIFAEDRPTTTDLSLMVDSVSIDGLTKTDGNYSALPGKEYTINLNFTEDRLAKKEYEFDNTHTLQYTLPSGLESVIPTLNSTTDTALTITITDADNKTYEIKGNKWSINQGVISIDFNQLDQNYGILVDTHNVHFTFSFKGKFSSSNSSITIPGTSTVITVGSPYVDITKNGYIEKTSSGPYIAHYTLTATANGSLENVQLIDTFSNSGVLTYNNKSPKISVSGNGNNENQVNMGAAEEKYHVSANENNNVVTYTIPNMNDGDVVTIEYTANVNFDNYTGAGTIEETNNTLTSNYKNPDPKKDVVSKNFENQISYRNPQKSMGTATTSGNIETIPWTVTYNDPMREPINDGTITDTISFDNQNVDSSAMTYVQDSLIINVIDSNGNIIREDTLKNAADKISFAENGLSFTYQPKDTKTYKYVVSYNTTVDQSKLTRTSYLTNTVKDNHNEQASQGTNISPSTNPDTETKTARMVKEVSGVTDSTVNWTITLTIPKEGLSTNATVVDEVPSTWVGNTHCYDDVVLNADNTPQFTIDANTPLLTGESCTATIVNTDQSHTVHFTFTTNGVEGLSASTDKRIIKIHLTTNTNQTWAALGDANTQVAHTNKATFYADNQTIKKEATAYPKFKIKKSLDYNDLNNQLTKDNLPYYKFYIDIPVYRDGTNTVTVTDTFNTTENNYFTLLQNTDFSDSNNPGATMYAQYRNIYNEWFNNKTINVKSISASLTPDSTNPSGVTFTIDKSNVPASATCIRVYYQLKVKDAAALQALQQKTLNAGQCTDSGCVYNGLSNTAGYNSATDSVNFSYTYYPATKSVVMNDTNKTLDYTVVLNPGAVSYTSDHSTYEATDTFSSNMRILYKTITADSDDVKWDVSGDTITFSNIPDGKKITITYSAKPLEYGKGTKEYSNSISVIGYTKNVTKEHEFSYANGGG